MPCLRRVERPAWEQPRVDPLTKMDAVHMPQITPSTPAAVVWDGVSKVYPNGYRALDQVSLGVRPGEILALLGTSGSGKTTLLKMVNRLIDASEGRVLVRGRPTAEWDPIVLRRSIGYVIQE